MTSNSMSDPTNSKLLDYFAKNPPTEEEVDVDAALEEANLDEEPIRTNDQTDFGDHTMQVNWRSNISGIKRK